MAGPERVIYPPSFEKQYKDAGRVVAGTAGSNDHPNNEDALWPLDSRIAPFGEKKHWPLSPFEYLMGGRLYIVADGVSSSQDSRLASHEAVRQIGNHYYFQEVPKLHLASQPEEIRAALKQAIVAADKDVQSQVAGGYTTCVCALIRGNELYLANVGDSRAYLLAGSSFTMETIDDVQPGTSSLIQALGKGNVKPTVSGPHLLKSGHRILLCSDGLYEQLEDKILKEFLENRNDFDKLPNRLLTAAIQKSGDRPYDDITIIVYDYTPQSSQGDLDNEENRIESACWWSEKYDIGEQVWIDLVLYYDERKKASKDNREVSEYERRLARLGHPNAKQQPPIPPPAALQVPIPPTELQAGQVPIPPPAALQVPIPLPAITKPSGDTVLSEADALLKKLPKVWNELVSQFELREHRLYKYLKDLLDIITDLQAFPDSQNHLDKLVDVRTQIRLVVRLLAVLLAEASARELFDDFLWPEVERYYGGGEPGQIYEDVTGVSLATWRMRFFDLSDSMLDSRKWSSEERFRIRWCALRWLECASEDEWVAHKSGNSSKIKRLGPNWKDSQYWDFQNLKAGSMRPIEAIQQELEDNFSNFPKLRANVSRNVR